MSVTSGPINEAEQAGEKLAAKLENDAPSTFGQVINTVLDQLANRQLVIRISLDSK